MKLDAKMVNLLGLLAVVAVLGLGTIGLVMPMYESVQATQGEVSTAELTNDSYRNRLTVLDASEAQQAEIKQNVMELHSKLPAKPQNDTMLQVVVDAMKSTGAFVDSDSYAEVTAFAPRGDANTAAAGTSEPAPPADPGASESSEGTSSEATGVDPKQQIEFELVVSVRDAAMATAFLDELRKGPRALLVTSAAVVKSSAHVVTGFDGTLKVKALMFYYENGE